MADSPDPVRDITTRLSEAALIPPVKAVEQRGGGSIQIVVSGPVSDDLRTRVAQALATVRATRWTLQEAAGTDYR